MPARLAQLPAPLKRDISETKVFGPMFEEQLKLWGWHAEHHRPGMRANGRWQTMVSVNGVGWPDYFCTHPGTGDCFVAELKTRYDKPSEAQLEWLAILARCGIETHVWWPPDWPQMVERLACPRRIVTPAVYASF
jgi:hypothetical protein